MLKETHQSYASLQNLAEQSLKEYLTEAYWEKIIKKTENILENHNTNYAPRKNRNLTGCLGVRQEKENKETLKTAKKRLKDIKSLKSLYPITVHTKIPIFLHAYAARVGLDNFLRIVNEILKN